MVNLTVLGISLHADSAAPVLLLHPARTEKVLSLNISPQDAFTIATLLHSSGSPSLIASERTLLFHAEENGELQETGSNSKNNDSEVLLQQPTHDLLLNIMRSLGGKLNTVSITLTESGTYSAELVLTRGPQLLRLGCRLADAIVLALRSGVVISASDELVAFAEDLEEAMATLPEQIKTSMRAFIATTEPLAGAVTSSGSQQKGVLGVGTTMEVSDMIITDSKGTPQQLVIRITPARQKIELRQMTAVEKKESEKAEKPKSPEEERWAALLAELTPETKVPM